MKFKSSHKLKFRTAPHVIAGAPTGMEKFEIGTVHGLWVQSKMSIDIFACINDEPGNGHMDDVFEWFFEIARTGALAVRIVNVSSVTFRNQLIEKWKFAPTDDFDTLINFVVK